MSTDNDFGSKLKKLRKAKGYTQEQLAEKVGIDYKYLSKIENGIHLPNYKTIKKFSDALQTNIENSDYFPKNTNPDYSRALKILNSATNEKELAYYLQVLKLANKGIHLTET